MKPLLSIAVVRKQLVGGRCRENKISVHIKYTLKLIVVSITTKTKDYFAQRRVNCPRQNGGRFQPPFLGI
jgi:hypothetical protein